MNTFQSLSSNHPLKTQKKMTSSNFKRFEFSSQDVKLPASPKREKGNSGDKLPLVTRNPRGTELRLSSLKFDISTGAVGRWDSSPRERVGFRWRRVFCSTRYCGCVEGVKVQRKYIKKE